MGDHSKIEWTDASWNPIRAHNHLTGGVGHFCIHASEGCRNCYAERLQPRFENPIRFAAQDRDKVEIFLDEKMLTQPLRWKRPRRIFVGSMTDLFADFVTDDMLDQIFAVTALCPQHTFQLLTKRPERMREYLSGEANRRSAAASVQFAPLDGDNVVGALPLNRQSELVCGWAQWPLPNVWLGVSAEDQATADERIPLLLETPAAVRFVSYEPALGPIDFTNVAVGIGDTFEDCGGCPDPFYPKESVSWNRHDTLRGQYWHAIKTPDGKIWTENAEVVFRTARLDWIIVGGESGPAARPMHPDWARSARNQCAAAGVPFFFKQWGEWREFDHESPTEEVDAFEDELAADAWAAAVRPGFISHAGEFYPNRRSLPEEVPCRLVERLGKQAAGRLLDGCEHNELPSATKGIQS